MQLQVSGELWYWRGPSPFHFVTVPDAQCAELESVAPLVSYGWGMVPVGCRIGATSWATALWPKDGAYLVPIKSTVRRAEGIELGDEVTVHLTVSL